VGWLPGLRRFVDEVDEQIRLALSLHAPEDALRSELMPVNDRDPLEVVLAECRRYAALRGRRVFIKYVMLAGVNDTVGQARSLARLLGPKDFKVNLIPYNRRASSTAPRARRSPPSARRSCRTAFPRPSA
jgi:23S rRNA (adenine2503-C2)-methyltransferase